MAIGLGLDGLRTFKAEQRRHLISTTPARAPGSDLNSSAEQLAQRTASRETEKTFAVI
nr:hypothetical protein [uncultured Brevundimonas sp.]